jgi:phosphoglycolate phosphatase-like HAD superfamily hydrolase
MAPAAVLFDMDGILADVAKSYRTAIVEVCTSRMGWMAHACVHVHHTVARGGSAAD